VPKKKWNKAEDNSTHKLLSLAGNIKAEEEETQAEEEGGPEEELCCDNDEGWVDECKSMTEDNIENLEESMQPIQFLLIKIGGMRECCIVLANQSLMPQICKLAYAIRTQAQLLSLSGIAFSRISRSTSVLYPMTFAPARVQHTTCLTVPTSTGKQSIRSPTLSPARDTNSKQDSYGRPLTVRKERKGKGRKLKSDVFCP
jgi:hypothetical protein